MPLQLRFRNVPSPSLEPNSPPVRRLPDEVLVYIFLLTLQGESAPPTTPEKRLLSITKVCSQWRTLARTSGELWARVVIGFPDFSKDFQRVRTWIELSGTYPLNITIDIRDPDWNFVEDDHAINQLQMQALMGLVLPHVERWQSMKIFADYWTPIRVFLEFTQNMYTPQLRKLALRVCNPFPTGALEGGLYALFGGRPLKSLQTITLEGVHVDWSDSRALHDLKSLSFGLHTMDIHPLWEEFLHVLRASPKLHDLTLGSWGPNLDSNEVQDFRGSIHLPELSRLCLNVTRSSYSIKLLSLFNLPSLQSLTIDKFNSNDPSDSDSLQVFDYLAGYPPQGYTPTFFPHLVISPLPTPTNLTKLALKYLDLNQNGLRRFFQRFSNLRALAIQHCEAEVLLALGPNETGTTPLLELKTLEIISCDPTALADTISHRRANRIINPTDITFQFQVSEAEDGSAPTEQLPLELVPRFAELGIRVLPPLVTKYHEQWRRFETDDSEELVAAILNDDFEVPGASLSLE